MMSRGLPDNAMADHQHLREGARSREAATVQRCSAAADHGGGGREGRREDKWRPRRPQRPREVTRTERRCREAFLTAQGPRSSTRAKGQDRGNLRLCSGAVRRPTMAGVAGKVVGGAPMSRRR